MSIMRPDGKPRGRWVAWILPLAVGCMFEFAWSSRSPDGSSSSLASSAFLSAPSVGNVAGAPAPPPAPRPHVAPHHAEQSQQQQQQHHHHVPGSRHHLAPVAIYRSPASLRTGHGESRSPLLSSTSTLSLPAVPQALPPSFFPSLSPSSVHLSEKSV